MRNKTTYAIYSSILGIILLSSIAANESSFQAFAQSNSSGFTVRNAEQIENDPFAKSILEKIELMKKSIAEQKESKQKELAHQKFIEQQRAIAEKELEKDLGRMNDKNKNQTPKASFTTFVSSKPPVVQKIYWDMFNFQKDKVDDARDAMKIVLENGGSLQDARDAYHDTVAMKRIQLIEVTKESNIKHGVADKIVQSGFDIFGKMPRTD